MSECLSAMNQKNCIHKIYLQENTGNGVPLSTVAVMWVTVFQNGLHHRGFSMKTVKFHRTSILRNNAARLLLISCDIFDVSFALSVINHFSHGMEI